MKDTHKKGVSIGSKQEVSLGSNIIMWYIWWGNDFKLNTS